MFKLRFVFCVLPNSLLAFSLMLRNLMGVSIIASNKKEESPRVFRIHKTFARYGNWFMAGPGYSFGAAEDTYPWWTVFLSQRGLILSWRITIYLRRVVSAPVMNMHGNFVVGMCCCWIEQGGVQWELLGAAWSYSEMFCYSDEVDHSK